MIVATRLPGMVAIAFDGSSRLYAPAGCCTCSHTVHLGHNPASRSLTLCQPVSDASSRVLSLFSNHRPSLHRYYHV